MSNSSNILLSLSRRLCTFGCPFIIENDVTEKRLDEITELLMKPCQEREKILRWCFSQLCPETKEMKIIDCILGFGICRNMDEATQFVAAALSPKQQELKWVLLLKLLSGRGDKKVQKDEPPEQEKTPEKELKVDNWIGPAIKRDANNAIFIDMLAESGSLDKQLECPIEVTPYNIERDVKSLKMEEVPSSEVLNKLRRTAEQEKVAITDRITCQKMRASVCTASEEEKTEALEEFKEESENVCNNVGGFEERFLTELMPWLSGRGKKEVVERPEVEAVEARMEKFQEYFSSNMVVSSCSHLVDTTGGKMNEVLSSVNNTNNTFLDIEKLALNDTGV